MLMVRSATWYFMCSNCRPISLYTFYNREKLRRKRERSSSAAAKFPFEPRTKGKWGKRWRGEKEKGRGRGRKLVLFWSSSCRDTDAGSWSLFRLLLRAGGQGFVCSRNKITEISRLQLLTLMVTNLKTIPALTCKLSSHAYHYYVISL